jgi:hypothetical protein
MIFPSLRSLRRVDRYSRDILTHPLFASRVFLAHVIWPAGDFDEFPTCLSVQTSCGPGKFSGFHCRIEASLRLFLAGGASWYFRAMDDSWINPGNFLEYIGKLETFVDPDKHVVIKAAVYRYISGADLVQGGSGVLLSRAAVEFIVAANFTRLTRFAFLHQEDTTFTLPCFALFNETAAWSDFRFVGPDTGYRTRWIMPPIITEHSGTNFRDFNISCQSKLVFPLRAAVAFHTTGLPQLEWLIRVAHELPMDLATEWNGRAFLLCRCSEGLLDEMVSVEALMRATPLVTREEADRASFVEIAKCADDLRFCRYVSQIGSLKDDKHGVSGSQIGIH